MCAPPMPLLCEVAHATAGCPHVGGSSARAGGVGPRGARALSPSAPPTACAASDVYSLGVCAAEVHGGFRTRMERAVVVGRLATPSASCTDRAPRLLGGDAATALARWMLCAEAAARPSAADVSAAAAKQAQASA